MGRACSKTNFRIVLTTVCAAVFAIDVCKKNPGKKHTVDRKVKFVKLVPLVSLLGIIFGFGRSFSQG